VEGDVVPGIDDHAEVGVGRGGAQAAGETGTADSAGESHDATHGEIQPTKILLRRLKVVPKLSGDAVWAVVVARVGNGAKSRLADVLSPDERRRLALAMLADVLDVCAHEHDLFDGTLAVLDDPVARDVAQASGALALEDPAAGDMNRAVSVGVQAAHRHAATTVIVLPGDIPLVSRRDLDALLATAGNASRAVIVGPSRDGQGTNALLLRPPDVIVPAFGPPSVDRHLRAGLASGAVARIRTGLDLALDVDTPDDLRALPAAHVRANTEAALALIGTSWAATYPGPNLASKECLSNAASPYWACPAPAVRSGRAGHCLRNRGGG
jgi:2-phospho-L-lactate guanylyltransferase